MFTHFLITRFNLKVPEWQETRDGERVLDKSWLEDRFNVFEKYCLPSVINQTNKNFFWLIYFDISTPVEYHQNIEAIKALNPNYHCYYIDGLKNLEKEAIRSISQLIKPNIEWVITTRLDNDDSIHKDFIQKIQDSFVPVHNTIVDARSGFQINVQKRKTELRKISNEFNPFISLIESSSDFQTSASKRHRDFGNFESLVILDSMPLWIEVVHKKNKLNDVSSKILLEHEIDLSSFGLDKSLFNTYSAFAVNLKNLKFKVFGYIDYQIGIAKIIVAKLKKGKLSNSR